MSDWSEIEKKQCPDGFHSHPNNTRCHPISQPHRPGSKAEKEHFEMGLENSWYAQHGTTKEEYEKEHAEDTKEKEPEKPEEEKTPEKEPEKEPEPEVPSDEPIGSIRYEAVRDMNRNYPEARKTVQEYKERFEKVTNDPEYKDKSNIEIYSAVFGDDVVYKNHFNGMEDREFISQFSREQLYDFIRCSIESSENFPAVSFMFKNVQKYPRAVMAYDGRDMGLCLNPDKALNPNVDMGTREVTIKDPITKEDSVWSFHFKGANTTNSVQHEFGHGVSRYLACLKASMEYPSTSEVKDLDAKVTHAIEESGAVEDHDNILYGASLNRNYLSSHSLPYIGYKSIGWGHERPNKWRYPYVFVPRSYYGYENPEEQKEILDRIYKEYSKHLEDTDFEMDPEPMEYSEDGRTKYAFKLRRKESASRKRLDAVKESKDFEGLAKEFAKSYSSDPVQYEMQKNRVRECEALYKKIFKVKKIIPSDVYSGYGYYGVSVFMTEGKAMEKKGLNEVNSDEILAEAYSDVSVRKERANSMSQLLVAHTYYEQAQIMDGYEGSFEDYVKEKVGMDLFKERIIKFQDTPVWYDYLVWDKKDRIAKGFRKDTPKEILNAYRKDYNEWKARQ